MNVADLIAILSLYPDDSEVRLIDLENDDNDEVTVIGRTDMEHEARLILFVDGRSISATYHHFVEKRHGLKTDIRRSVDENWPQLIGKPIERYSSLVFCWNNDGPFLCYAVEIEGKDYGTSMTIDCDTYDEAVANEMPFEEEC